METTHVNLNEKNRGTIDLLSDGKKIGKMDISVRDKALTVHHTEVDEAYGGRGFAGILLDKLVSYAQENNLKIIPLCPYVHAQFKRNPEKYDSIWLKNNK